MSEPTTPSGRAGGADGEPELRGASGIVAVSEGLSIAWEALWANRIRSGLTVLGVAVGVSVVVAIASLITGIRTSVMSAFESAGPNNFVVTRFDFTAVRISDDGNNRPPWWNKPQIEASEATRIGRLATIDEALYNFQFQADIEFESESVRGIQGQGYSSGWPRYALGEFTAGRDFTEAEVRQNRPVVTDLFGGRDPIGKRVRIGSTFRGTLEEFTVVGVFAPEPNIFSAAVSHWMVVPWTAAKRRLRASDWQAQILVVPDDSVTIERAQDDVRAARWLTVAGSLRYDHHSRFGGFLSPRLSALVRTAGWVARVSAGTGFFAPTPFTEEVEAVGLARLTTPVDWVEERTARVKLTDPQMRRAVLKYHNTAREFWQSRFEAANAE